MLPVFFCNLYPEADKVCNINVLTLCEAGKNFTDNLLKYNESMIVPMLYFK